MAFDPDQYLASKTESPKISGGFDPDAYLKSKAPEPDKVTPLESISRGTAQGLSLNFADEISGGAEALWEKAKGDPKEFGELYKKYRDESRANFKKAETQNPTAYKAGEVGGSLITAAIPIGSTATIAKAATTGARLGAVSALGASEADNAKDLTRDIAIGTGVGFVGGAAGKGLEKGIGAIRAASKSASEAGAKSLSQEAAAATADDPNVIKEVSQSAKNRIKSFFNPEVDPKFEEFADIARKNGIDPETLPNSIKFGPASSASRAERNIAEGRYGEETLKRFDNSLNQVRNAYDQKIIKYSGGAPVDEVTAGKVLRDSYDEGVTKFFDQMDITHNSIINQVPDFRLTPEAASKIESSLNGVEKFAKGRMIRGVTQTQRGQGQQLMNAVDAIRAGNGSYKQTVEALRDIGEAAFQSKNSLADVPVDTQKMRKLYNDISESLTHTVKSELGDDIASSLVANNKAMSEFFGDESLVSRVMGDKAIAPEKAFQSLVLSGDTKKIEALKKIIPPEKWEYLKGAVLENLVKRDPEGGFTFRQLYSNMRNKKNTLSAIFTPEELSESAGIVRLGDRFGSPVLSSSGTGASLSFKDLAKDAGNLSVDSYAIKRANQAASRAKDVIQEKVERDVSPTLKSLPSRAAGALAGENYMGGSKGPEKWVKVGAGNLQSAGIDEATIESLSKTKSGRDLLIEASDAKPNSTRMNSIIKRINGSNKGGQ